MTSSQSPAGRLADWRALSRSEAEAGFARLARDLETWVADELQRQGPLPGQDPRVWADRIAAPVVAARVAALSARLERDALNRLAAIQGDAPNHLPKVAPQRRLTRGQASATWQARRRRRMVMGLVALGAAVSGWVVLGAPAPLAAVAAIVAVTFCAAGLLVPAPKPEELRLARVQLGLRRGLLEGPDSQLGLYLLALDAAHARLLANQRSPAMALELA